MDFLKKNYIKIIVALMMIIGAIFFIMLIAQYDKSFYDFVNQFDATKSGTDSKYALSYLYSFIAALSFFVLGFVFVIISMIEKTKKYSKWTVFATAILCTILMVMSLVSVSTSKSSQYSKDIQNGIYDQAITYAVTQGVTAEVTAGIEASIAEAVATSVSAGTGGAISAQDVPTNSATSEIYEAAYKQAYSANFQNYLSAKMNSDEIKTMIASIADEKTVAAKSTAKYQSMSYLSSLIAQLLVFGLLPLCYGLKKILRQK